jgi:hypothetical protein
VRQVIEYCITTEIGEEVNYVSEDNVKQAVSLALQKLLQEAKPKANGKTRKQEREGDDTTTVYNTLLT